MKMIFLFLLSGIGFVASVLVHIITFMGINLEESFPMVWGLSYGLFVLYLSIAFYNKKVGKDNVKQYWKPVVESVPKWLMFMVVVLLVYGVINIFYVIFVLSAGGKPAIINGQKVLRKHKKVVRALTDEEYAQHKAYRLRAASGIWMFFYYLPFPVTLTCLLRKNSDLDRTDGIFSIILSIDLTDNAISNII